jgi:hypothetical protein
MNKIEHPTLHLLAVERIGWRRWIFGRWVYNDEPFRRDIQRRIAADPSWKVDLCPGEQLFPGSDLTH